MSKEKNQKVCPVCGTALEDKEEACLKCRTSDIGDYVNDPNGLQWWTKVRRRTPLYSIIRGEDVSLTAFVQAGFMKDLEGFFQEVVPPEAKKSKDAFLAWFNKKGKRVVRGSRLTEDAVLKFLNTFSNRDFKDYLKSIEHGTYF